MLAAALLLAQLAGGADLVPRVLEGAHRQVGVTVSYDGSYRRIPYPGGDVPLRTGVCTDVVVRAYRNAGIDLQVLVHEDVKAAPNAYPTKWGPRRAPDPSIDHRRVLNLAVFFLRKGKVLPVSRDADDYAPGDLVTWRLPSGLPHIGIVSDRREAGRPLVIHNIGSGTKVEDILFRFPITGHFRYPR